MEATIRCLICIIDVEQDFLNNESIFRPADWANYEHLLEVSDSTRSNNIYMKQYLNTLAIQNTKAAAEMQTKAKAHTKKMHGKRKTKEDLQNEDK